MVNKLKRFGQHILSYWSYFSYGLFTLIGGLYVFAHLNYLDDPRVTTPPPPAMWERDSFGFADDWWFASLLVFAGIILLIGVLLDKRLFRNVGLIMIAPLYGSLAFAFIVRGFFDFRFNLTWLFACLALVLLFGTAMRGGWHDD